MISSCPSCGAEPWCNIDCELCNVVAGLRSEHDRMREAMTAAKAYRAAVVRADEAREAWDEKGDGQWLTLLDAMAAAEITEGQARSALFEAVDRLPEVS